MTYEGRLELHLRHLKLKRKSPYQEEFENYVEPVEKPVEKTPEEKALDKVAEKVSGKIVDLERPIEEKEPVSVPEKEVQKPEKKEAPKVADNKNSKSRGAK